MYTNKGGFQDARRAVRRAVHGQPTVWTCVFSTEFDCMWVPGELA